MVYTKKKTGRDNSIRTYKTRREASVKAAKASFQKAPVLFDHIPSSLPDVLRELHDSLEMLGKDNIYKEVQVCWLGSLGSVSFVTHLFCSKPTVIRASSNYLGSG